MEKDVYETVRNCCTFAQSCSSSKMEKEIQLFPASGTHEFVAINILGPLPRVVNGKENVIVMTDRYVNLTCAMQTGRTVSSSVPNLCFDFWVAPTKSLPIF